MNDSLDPIARELRAFDPAAPPASLRAAIAHRLDAAAVAAAASGAEGPRNPGWPRRARWSLFAAWSVAGAAACLAGVAWWQAGNPGRSAEADATAPAAVAAPTGPIPVSSSNVLCAAEDEGIVFLDDGVPARRVRYTYIDTLRLTAPADDTAIAVRYPREEIRFVPLNLY